MSFFIHTVLVDFEFTNILAWLTVLRKTYMFNLACLFVYDRGDPFQVEPLPKTFYYPSQLKELPEDQRKVPNSKYMYSIARA